MAALSIGGQSFSDPTGLPWRRTADKYWLDEEPPVSADYGNDWTGAPGVDGMGNAQEGFQSRPLRFLVGFVAASSAACVQAFEAVRDALEASVAGFTVATQWGTSYENCYLAPQGMVPLGTPRETEAGTFWVEAIMQLEQRKPNSS